MMVKKREPLYASCSSSQFTVVVWKRTPRSLASRESLSREDVAG